MRKMTWLAAKDHEGIERPALLIQRYEDVGTVVDWLRTGYNEVLSHDRVRVVTDEREWDLACEFDAFAAPCFQCGTVKPDPRPFSLCARCAERTYACLSCGQLQDHVGLCAACAGRDRAPQGEPLRLFAPAPTQLPGQLNF